MNEEQKQKENKIARIIYVIGGILIVLYVILAFIYK